jgi:hypothetical protein
MWPPDGTSAADLTSPWQYCPIADSGESYSAVTVAVTPGMAYGHLGPIAGVVYGITDRVWT